MSIVLKLALAAVCVVACVVLVSCQRKRADDEPMRGFDGELPLAVTPLAEGWTSAIRDERFVVVRGLGDWHGLWFEHTRTQLPRPPIPKVDFAENMVVAVFLGERSTLGYGVTIESCTSRAEQVRVTAIESVPDPTMMQAQVMSAPFVLVTTPRADGDCVFELRAR